MQIGLAYTGQNHICHEHSMTAVSTVYCFCGSYSNLHLRYFSFFSCSEYLFLNETKVLIDVCINNFPVHTSEFSSFASSVEYVLIHSSALLLPTLSHIFKALWLKLMKLSHFYCIGYNQSFSKHYRLLLDACCDTTHKPHKTRILKQIFELMRAFVEFM